MTNTLDPPNQCDVCGPQGVDWVPCAKCWERIRDTPWDEVAARWKSMTGGSCEIPVVDDENALQEAMEATIRQHQGTHPKEYDEYVPTHAELEAATVSGQPVGETEVDIEVAVRRLWNADHDHGHGFGNYDSFKAKYPNDCKAHGADYRQIAKNCAEAWGLKWR